MFVAAHAADLTFVFMPGHTPGDRLKELRTRLKLSLRQAAQRAETISYSTIRALEERTGSWSKVEFGTLQALSRAYAVPLDYLISLVFQDDDAPDIATQLLKAIERRDVHPNWHALPIYDVVDAGDLKAATPMEDDVAYIPKEHLSRRGVDVDSVRVFQVTGSCMISDEARSAAKNYGPGDYIAVDINGPHEPGAVVVAWWEEQKTLVIKRYALDRDQVVLFPLSRFSPNLIASEGDVAILGPVVWSGG